MNFVDGRVLLHVYTQYALFTYFFTYDGGCSLGSSVVFLAYHILQNFSEKCCNATYGNDESHIGMVKFTTVSWTTKISQMPVT